MALNRGGRWYSDEEMVLGVRRRDWSQVGVMDNGGALVAPFIGSSGGGRRTAKGREEQRRWNFNDASYGSWKRERGS
jgi:hypothetical protein